MKTQIRIASLALLAVLCLTLAALPASADILYDNGPINGNTGAWQINGGHVVSDSFRVIGPGSAGGESVVRLGVWELPGDTLTSLDWAVSTGPCSGPGGCGIILGSGTASGANLTDTVLFSNQYGYNIDAVAAANINASKSNTFLYLTLGNANVPSGDPVYWDENSGVGCQSDGCPSQAYDSALGTIPSEAFTIYGSGSSTPEPSSLLLFGSGVLGIGGLLRKRLFG
jgi:PEP-CTERM motif